MVQTTHGLSAKQLPNWKGGGGGRGHRARTVWNWHIWQGINQDWAKCDNIHQCLYANTSEQTSLLILIWTHCCDELPRTVESKTAVLRLGQYCSWSSGGGHSQWHILAVRHCSLLAASFFESAALHGRLRKLHVLVPPRVHFDLYFDQTKQTFNLKLVLLRLLTFLLPVFRCCQRRHCCCCCFGCCCCCYCIFSGWFKCTASAIAQLCAHCMANLP